MGLAFAFGLDDLHRTNLGDHAAARGAHRWAKASRFWPSMPPVSAAPLFSQLWASGNLWQPARKFKQNMVWVERGAGGPLIATGVLIMLGSLQAFATYLLDWFPFLATLG